jgi:hypothetical protein
VLFEQRGNLRNQLRRKRAARKRPNLEHVDDSRRPAVAALGQRQTAVLPGSVNREQKHL